MGAAQTPFAPLSPGAIRGPRTGARYRAAKSAIAEGLREGRRDLGRGPLPARRMKKGGGGAMRARPRCPMPATFSSPTAWSDVIPGPPPSAAEKRR